MIRIHDETGRERGMGWLREMFGPVAIHTPEGDAHSYEISALHARRGHACVIARVLDTDGGPLPDIPTVWSWPDAPELPGAGWLSKGVIGITNENGDIGHAMGKGANYAPPTRGPHALWIQGPGRSEMIDGLGMLTLQGRYHLDVTFQLRRSTPGEPGTDEDLRALFRIRERVDLAIEAADLLAHDLLGALNQLDVAALPLRLAALEVKELIARRQGPAPAEPAPDQLLDAKRARDDREGLG